VRKAHSENNLGRKLGPKIMTMKGMKRQQKYREEEKRRRLRGRFRDGRLFPHRIDEELLEKCA